MSCSRECTFLWIYYYKINFMFFVKKSSFFFLKALLLQSLILNKNILVFFDYFDLNVIKNDFVFYNSNFFFLSSSFMNFFFKNEKFLTFLRPSFFLFSFDTLDGFFSFFKNFKVASFFFLGISYKGIFLNSIFFPVLSRICDIFSMINLQNFFIFFFRFCYYLFFFFIYLFALLFFFW